MANKIEYVEVEKSQPWYLQLAEVLGVIVLMGVVCCVFAATAMTLFLTPKPAEPQVINNQATTYYYYTCKGDAASPDNCQLDHMKFEGPTSNRWTTASPTN